jgi:uncharacterized protein
MENHHNHTSADKQAGHSSCCVVNGNKKDWFLIIMSATIIVTYLLNLFAADYISLVPYLTSFAENTSQLINKMWHGVLIGIIFVGILSGVPKSLVYSVIGRGGTFGGVIRATAAGVLLDLCSHGILLVGMQLYKRGASLGQVMAFLIASPWNSISLTVILWVLVGIKWTLVILGFSFVIAIISGVVFDKLVAMKILPDNPNKVTESNNDGFVKEFKKYIASVNWAPKSFVNTLNKGLHESEMILRWIFFGIVLAALIQTFISTELFAQVFGPTILGLGATLIFATVLEVCSEGSMPIAADFLLRAGAPGNTFAFLMTGVSTDYTEIMSLKETTGSWKIAFFLPLVTFPQVVVIALILNQFAA